MKSQKRGSHDPQYARKSSGVIKNAPAFEHDAIIYIRANSADLDVHFSLKEQEAMCRAFCVNHRLNVRDVYQDVSSTSDDSRPELLHAIEHCCDEQKCITVLMVYSLDSITHSIAEYEAIQAKLEAHGVAILDLGDCACGDEFKTMISKSKIHDE